MPRGLDDLVAEMLAVLSTRPTEDWVSAFEAAGVPAGPVKTMAQVLEDPQVRMSDMVGEVEHPVAGTVSALGCPIKFSHGSGVTRHGSPLYGEHIVDVLREIGFSELETEALVAAKAVYAHRQLAGASV